MAELVTLEGVTVFSARPFDTSEINVS